MVAAGASHGPGSTSGSEPNVSVNVPAAKGEAEQAKTKEGEGGDADLTPTSSNPPESPALSSGPSSSVDPEEKSPGTSSASSPDRSAISLSSEPGTMDAQSDASRGDGMGAGGSSASAMAARQGTGGLDTMQDLSLHLTTTITAERERPHLSVSTGGNTPVTLSTPDGGDYYSAQDPKTPRPMLRQASSQSTPSAARPAAAQPPPLADEDEEENTIAKLSTRNVPLPHESNRVDMVLNDVFSLLSLFFLTIGKVRESPGTYCQIASMRVGDSATGRKPGSD